MPSYSNPNYFMPSADAYAAEYAANMANNMATGGSSMNPMSILGKGTHYLDQYLHITAPLRIRSGARVITRGGYLDQRGMSMEKWENTGWAKQEWLDNYTPRAWYRGGTSHSFDPRNASAHNWITWKTGKGERGEYTKFGKLMRDQMNKEAYSEKLGAINPDHWLRKSGMLTESGEIAHWWDPRMLSRFSASGDFAKMDTLSAKSVAGLTNYLRSGANEGLAGGIDRAVESGLEITGKDAAMMTRLGVSGAFSGRLSGMLEGARFGSDDVYGRLGRLGMGEAELNESVREGLKFGQTVRDWATDANGEKLAFKDILRGTAVSKREAADVAAKAVGTDAAKAVGGDIAKKLGSRLVVAGAEAVGALGEGGLNPVMDVLAIASIAELGFDVAHAGASMVAGEAKAAAKSFRGDINRTPGNGFGFHDTAASATARQRGLQAIAASRLNARSILGSEGGAMYAHFAGSEMGY